MVVKYVHVKVHNVDSVKFLYHIILYSVLEFIRNIVRFQQEGIYVNPQMMYANRRF